jgi:hypothetical protein
MITLKNPLILKPTGCDERIMERRREPRFAADARVMVTVLGAVKQPPMPGRVANMAGRGLLLRVPSPIVCGAAVKVEGDDMLLLGEVCRSRPAEACRAGAAGHLDEAGYEVALKISQGLASLSSLERFHRVLLGKGRVEDRIEF